ncbi:hypothetical protein ZWY2020_011953 [Hordeum vulgare]|nr:hypothetical protein ZWY2020_011953 [Hordeum vulgare]
MIMMLLVLLFFVGGANAALFFPTSLEYAYHHLEAGGSVGYYGVSVTMDVYALSLSNDQNSLAAVQISSGRDSIIRMAWEVYPRLYGGDSRSHLSAMWTNDGYRKTTCINTNCPVGFQPEAGAPFVLGDIIDPVSQSSGIRQSLTIKIIKDSASGDWLLHCGLNQRDPALIGRFPKSLFTGGLADRATIINIGGIAAGRTTDLPPMGSGYLPTNGTMATATAASFSNILIFHENGQSSLLPDNLPAYLTLPDAYSASPVIKGKFFYGGPS